LNQNNTITKGTNKKMALTSANAIQKIKDFIIS